MTPPVHFRYVLTEPFRVAGSGWYAFERTYAQARARMPSPFFGSSVKNRFSPSIFMYLICASRVLYRTQAFLRERWHFCNENGYSGVFLTALLLSLWVWAYEYISSAPTFYSVIADANLPMFGWRATMNIDRRLVCAFIDSLSYALYWLCQFLACCFPRICVFAIPFVYKAHLQVQKQTDSY
jgi:hypothetical protein